MSKISKKVLNHYLSLSNNLLIELVEDNANSFKIIIEGDKNKMAKSSFESEVRKFMKITIDFIKEQKEFNTKIEKDIDILKSFHKDEIENLKK